MKLIEIFYTSKCVSRHLVKVILVNSQLYIYIYKVCLENPAIVNNNSNGLRGIDATWQPRRVDWNVHV